MKTEIYSKKQIAKFAYQDIKDIYRELQTSDTGLNITQVEERRNINTWKEKDDTLCFRIRRAFFSPFTLVLLFLATISYLTNHWMAVDKQTSSYSSVLLFTMVLISGGIRLIQEMRLQHASRQINRLVYTNVKIKRDGKILEIPAKELLLGDYIYLSAGSQIPSDIRLINTSYMFVSQAAITGESEIIEKHGERYIGEKKNSYIQYPNLVFKGTTVISGKGEGIVIAVGNDTLYDNSYSEKIRKSDCFERGANSIAEVMLRFMLILVPIVFLISGIIKGSWMQALLFSISVAVGLIPEMLPTVINACLVKGSILMSKRKTIVKDINSMQGFGSMDVLCIDKTGTLTNESILLEYYMDILGNESEKVLDYAYLNSFYHSGIHNPIDKAILKCYDMPNKQQYYKNLTAGFIKKDEIPFDYDRKCVSILLSDNEDKQELIIKGDLESVLKRCCYIEHKEKLIPIEADDIRSMDIITEEMLEDGMKVIAIARKSVKNISKITCDDENDMILMGYLAFFDAPKKSAKEAIEKLKKLNVKTKILTGDRKEIAQSICRRIGMDYSSILTGKNLEKMENCELHTAIEYTEVFAELTPNQKVEIIKILRENGHTVGFLGDGMNDIPAICEADVGISVDTAVDTAKDIADVILLEKDLNVLEEGILEGRKTFINMSKYIRITASSNFGNIFSIVCASAFLPFLPMTSIQILFLNLLYDTLCIILPWDHVDKEDCQKPREWSGRTLGRFMCWFGPISSIFDILTFLFLYFILCPSVCGGFLFHQLSDPMIITKYTAVFQTGWFLESMWSQILILQMLRTTKIPFIQSRPAKCVVWIMLLGIIVFSGITITPLGSILGLTSLPIVYFFFLFIIVLCYLILTTMIKAKYLKKYHELI